MYDSGKWTGWADFKNRVAAELAARKDEGMLDKAKVGWDNKTKTATLTK